ncbi:hypothetical protein FA13DRAFT_1611941, partial [Coprinellus micaceus]
YFALQKLQQIHDTKLFQFILKDLFAQDPQRLPEFSKSYTVPPNPDTTNLID